VTNPPSSGVSKSWNEISYMLKETDFSYEFHFLPDDADARLFAHPKAMEMELYESESSPSNSTCTTSIFNNFISIS
jgi:hypothetical protein